MVRAGAKAKGGSPGCGKRQAVSCIIVAKFLQQEVKVHGKWYEVQRIKSREEVGQGHAFTVAVAVSVSVSVAVAVPVAGSR